MFHIDQDIFIIIVSLSCRVTLEFLVLRSQKSLAEAQQLGNESRQEIEKLTSKLAEVQKELRSQLDLAVQQGGEKEASFAEALASRDKELAQLRQNLETLEATRTNLESQLVSQSSEKEVSQKLLKEAEARVATLTNEKASAESAVKESEDKLQSATEELRVKSEELLSLQTIVSKKDEECEALKLSLAEAEKRREEVASSLAEGKGLSVQLEEKLCEKEKALAEMQEALQKLAEEKSSTVQSSLKLGDEIRKAQCDA